MGIPLANVACSPANSFLKERTRKEHARVLEWHCACLRSSANVLSRDQSFYCFGYAIKESPEGDPRMASYETTSNPSTVQAWNNLARNWVFACPLCGRMGIVITERLFWYSCRHCGYELASTKPPETVRRVISRREGLAEVQV